MNQDMESLLNELAELKKNEKRDDKNWNVRVAELSYLTSNFKESGEFYLKAFELGEDNIESIKQAGLALFYSQNYVEALKYLDKAVAADPSDMTSFALAMNCKTMVTTPQTTTEVDETVSLEDYYVIETVVDMMNPSVSCKKSSYLMHREPLSVKNKMVAEAPNSKKKTPSYETLKANLCLLMSERVRNVLAQFNLYRFQIIPTEYHHENGKQYDYYLGILENVLHIKNDVSDKSITFASKLDLDKLNNVPVQKRLYFEVNGNTGKTIVHKSIADELRKLKIKELHLVPLEEWTDSYTLRTKDEYSTAYEGDK